MPPKTRLEVRMLRFCKPLRVPRATKATVFNTKLRLVGRFAVAPAYTLSVLSNDEGWVGKLRVVVAKT